MLAPLVLGATLLAATVALHAIGTSWWVNRLRALRDAPRPVKPMTVLLRTAWVLFGLHLMQVLAWAMTYRLLPIAEVRTLEEAVYFSLVTFTTLGYGDIAIASHWRLLAGIEALNGIVLLGWSTALSFAVVQRLLQDDPPSPDDGGQG